MELHHSPLYAPAKLIPLFLDDVLMDKWTISARIVRQSIVRLLYEIDAPLPGRRNPVGSSPCILWRHRPRHSSSPIVFAPWMPGRIEHRT